MLQILYFASYRERLGLDHEQLPWRADYRDVAALRQALLARGGAWTLLAAPELLCARNQVLCRLDEPLCDGDEVAFFPPVTGG